MTIDLILDEENLEESLLISELNGQESASINQSSMVTNQITETALSILDEQDVVPPSTSIFSKSISPLQGRLTESSDDPLPKGLVTSILSTKTIATPFGLMKTEEDTHLSAKKSEEEKGQNRTATSNIVQERRPKQTSIFTLAKEDAGKSAFSTEQKNSRPFSENKPSDEVPPSIFSAPVAPRLQSSPENALDSSSIGQLPFMKENAPYHPLPHAEAPSIPSTEATIPSNDRSADSKDATRFAGDMSITCDDTPPPSDAMDEEPIDDSDNMSVVSEDESGCPEDMSITSDDTPPPSDAMDEEPIDDSDNMSVVSESDLAFLNSLSDHRDLPMLPPPDKASMECAKEPFSQKSEPNPLLEAFRMYGKYEKKTNKKGKELVDQAEKHFEDLEKIQFFWGKIADMLDDLPDTYTFEGKEVEEGLPVLIEHGLVEEGKRIFTKSELKGFYAKLNAKMKILGEYAAKCSSDAGRALEDQGRVVQILQKILEAHITFLNNITRRTGGQ